MYTILGKQFSSFPAVPFFYIFAAIFLLTQSMYNNYGCRLYQITFLEHLNGCTVHLNSYERFNFEPFSLSEIVALIKSAWLCSYLLICVQNFANNLLFVRFSVLNEMRCTVISFRVPTSMPKFCFNPDITDNKYYIYIM